MDRDRLCLGFLTFFSLLLPGDSELLLPLESEPECFLLSLVVLFLLSCLESCLMILTDIKGFHAHVALLQRAGAIQDALMAPQYYAHYYTYQKPF